MRAATLRRSVGRPLADVCTRISRRLPVPREVIMLRLASTTGLPVVRLAVVMQRSRNSAGGRTGTWVLEPRVNKISHCFHNDLWGVGEGGIRTPSAPLESVTYRF
jgi:hypothetical protein